jgi:hypothetical protein
MYRPTGEGEQPRGGSPVRKISISLGNGYGLSVPILSRLKGRGT